MAAELAALIRRYQQGSLVQAAEHLTVAKAGLEAQGVLPPRLEEDHDHLPPDPSAAASIELNQYGKTFIPGPWVPFEQLLPLDGLGLSRRARNSLVVSGFRTVAHVQAAVDQGLLRKVRLSRVRARSRRSCKRLSAATTRCTHP